MKRTFTTETQLATFAAEFGRTLVAGDVVALGGPLGAGKTTFVRAVVRERLGHDPTSSPTFTFRHRYEPAATAPAQPAIEHLDFFRIREPEETLELGLEEAFMGEAIVFVEWWDRAPQLLPKQRYEVAFEGVGDGPRHLRVHKRT